jgi:SAM-dependent methyltransferase
MRWQLKAAALAALSVVPCGPRLYRRLQDLAGTSRLDLDTDYGYGSKAGALRRLRDHGADLPHCDVLEVGTGWHAVLPLLLSAAGARSVTTIDLNRWLTRRSLREALTGLRGIAGRIERDVGVPIAATVDTSTRVERALERGECPTDALGGARIAYRAPLDLVRAAWPDGAFGVAVSTNVLEHVRPDALRRMHAELARLVRPGGLVLHLVNPGDHFAVDPRITTANFLRYGPARWGVVGGWRLSYHNRLRCVDHVRWLEAAGLRVEASEARLDERALRALRAGHLRPHRAFAGYRDTELCEDLVTIVARRPA